jgi:hypothetical protein
MATRPKVLISYAHADKAFARELKAELDQFCDVWIDEDDLKVGDSLFGQISKGLSEADYAVVILTPSYIGSTWTTRELAGLIALEETTKKLILPVWKDIDRAGIVAFSPIIADILAAQADLGAAAVAQSLRLAIESASRAVELAKRTTSGERLSALGRHLKAKAEAEARLRTPEGVEQTRVDFALILDHLEAELKGSVSTELQFQIRRQAGSLVAHTRDQVSLHVEYRPTFMNDATRAELRVRVFKRMDPPVEAVPILRNLTYKPWFAAGMTVWKRGEKEVHSDEMVVDAILAMLHDEVATRSSR